jgi:hypothetical protein
MEYSDGLNAFKVTKHSAFRVVVPHIKDAVFKGESYENVGQSF